MRRYPGRWRDAVAAATRIRAVVQRATGAATPAASCAVKAPYNAWIGRNGIPPATASTPPPTNVRIAPISTPNWKRVYRTRSS